MGLVAWPLNGVGVDLVFKETLVLFLFKFILSSIINIILEKAGGFHQNKVNSNPISIQKLSNQAHNCKMVYSRSIHL